MHSGPAIAVNSNDRLDYFGRTVNMASRIQSQESGNDIVFSRDYMEQDKIQALLTGSDIELKPFPAALKGIEGNMELVRASMKEKVLDISAVNKKVMQM